MRAGADGARVALDDVPDRGEVHAGPHDGEDLPRPILHRCREEERGLVRNDRVRGVADVGSAGEGRDEVLAELHARPLVGQDRRRGDGPVRVDHRDRFVLRRPGRGGREGRPSRGFGARVGEVPGVADDVRELGDEHDVAQPAREVGVDRVRRRRRALTDVGDAEVGELVPRAVDRDEAHERDRYDPDHQQGGENFLPKPNTWPTHISPALRDGPHSSWRPYARVSLVRFHQADQSWNGRRSYRKGPSTKSGGAAPRPPRLG